MPSPKWCNSLSAALHVFLREASGWSLTWTRLHQVARTPAHGLFMFVTIVMVPTPQDCWAAITKYGHWLRVITKQFEAARVRLVPLDDLGALRQERLSSVPSSFLRLSAPYFRLLTVD